MDALENQPGVKRSATSPGTNSTDQTSTTLDDIKPFRASWWCRSPHIQTLWPVLTKRQPQFAYRRQRLELDDGDFLDLDWSGFPENTRSIVLILHGLEGCSHSHYVRGIVQALNRNGHCSVVMHHRGCSGEPNRLARGYHSGDTGDIESVVSLLRHHHPESPLAVLGYSLGGNILLKWLGENNRDKQVYAAIAVSVPFELEVAARKLENGFSSIYQHYLMRHMKASVHRKFTQRRAPVDLAGLNRTNTFYEFDDLFTGPIHGFEDAPDYYTRSSCKQYLGGILQPCLIVHAKDDPFMSPDIVPTPDELSNSTELAVSHNGGHAGFICGASPLTPRYWLEQRIPAYLEKYLASR